MQDGKEEQAKSNDETPLHAIHYLEEGYIIETSEDEYPFNENGQSEFLFNDIDVHSKEDKY